jgi:hypothetical protein
MRAPPNVAAPPEPAADAGLEQVRIEIPRYLQPLPAMIVDNEGATPETVTLCALEQHIFQYLRKAEPDDDSTDR